MGISGAGNSLPPTNQYFNFSINQYFNVYQKYLPPELEIHIGGSF
jgi:hypothetical protein